MTQQKTYEKHLKEIEEKLSNPNAIKSLKKNNHVLSLELRFNAVFDVKNLKNYSIRRITVENCYCKVLMVYEP